MPNKASCLFNHPVPTAGTGTAGFGMIMTIITTTTGFRGASG